MLKKSMKAVLICSFVLLFTILTACGNDNQKSSQVEKPKKPEKLPVATITIKDFGVIEAELYPHIAPNTVYNFISLSNKGFYDGLKIHRIVKDFVIQGGDPEGTGAGGPGYTINGEFSSNGFENNLLHTAGVLSMARTNDPNSAGSQFFIMTNDSTQLDGEYASFGKVTKGMDIVKNIEAAKTTPEDQPETPIIIESIKVDTMGVKYPKPKTNKE